MPQKRNPDVLELVRARASRIFAHGIGVFDIVKSAPSGYNRDLQEAKEPFMEGLAGTRASLRIMTLLVKGLEANEAALVAGFSPDVFATDRALELVGEGIPFRDAYHHVKANLGELENMDPHAAIRRKTHLGASSGLDFNRIQEQIGRVAMTSSVRRRRFADRVNALMKTPLY